MNILLFILAPVLTGYAIQGLRGKTVRISRKLGIAILALVLLFWVLRNVPGAPFSILAPS